MKLSELINNEETRTWVGLLATVTFFMFVILPIAMVLIILVCKLMGVPVVR